MNVRFWPNADMSGNDPKRTFLFHLNTDKNDYKHHFLRVHYSGERLNRERLRTWMGIDEKIFYNPEKVAFVPMGFCFPGTGKSGYLPHPSPRNNIWLSKNEWFETDVLPTLRSKVRVLINGGK